MRLLRLEDDGDVSIGEYAEEDGLRYAILSHRWGKDQDEVTFKDMVEKTGRDKKGFAKIRACGEQAQRDGFKFFWVDTCCIDKSSSAELSESINSMWRWYRKSGICYAYLDDVPAGVSIQERIEALTASKWFTRGWTLQELLAPCKLVLYNSAWEDIGSKDHLAHGMRISGITGISMRYIGPDPSPISSASIAERMSWASTRETKRPEDIAYCLLGIFDINMPLLYGEGQKAFQRLQEEIIKQSDDQSILAWIPATDDWDNISGRLFADSPARFKGCGNIIRTDEAVATKPYSITNKGLHIDLPIVGTPPDKLCGILNCQYSSDTFGHLALPLCKTPDAHHRRLGGKLELISYTDYHRAKPQSIYIMKRWSYVNRHTVPRPNTFFVRNLRRNHRIVDVYAGGTWYEGLRTFEGCANRDSPEDPDNRTVVEFEMLQDSRRLLFMTFFRRDLILNHWIWDARLLPPAETWDDPDLDQIHTEWKSRDLSVLPRVQQLGDHAVTIRTTPQLLTDPRLTIIDIIEFPQYNIFREAAERQDVLLRSVGQRFLRLIYWTASRAYSRLFENYPTQILGLITTIVVVPPVRKFFLSLPRWTVFLFEGLLYVDLYLKVRDRTTLMGGSWKDVRDYDAAIGYSLVVVFMFISSGLCFLYVTGFNHDTIMGLIGLFLPHLVAGTFIYNFNN
jgi:hypothetical protein